MFCSKCGAKIEEGATVCSSCGEINNHIGLEKPNNSKKKKGKGLFALVLIIPMVVAACFVFKSFGSIDFKNYINDDLKYYGISGYATTVAQSAIDAKSLTRDLAEKSDYYSVDEDISECIVIELDKTNLIANGDVITATITVNYDGFNSHNYKKKLKGKSQYIVKYKVKGIDEGVVIDPFEAIESISYDVAVADFLSESDALDIVISKDFCKEYEGGITYRYTDSHYGHLEVADAQGSQIGQIVIEAYTNEISSTGKITLMVSIMTDVFLNNGITFYPEKKEIEPVMIDYVKDASEFTPEMLESLEKEAVEFIKTERESDLHNIKLEKILFAFDEKYGNEANVVDFIFSGLSNRDNSACTDSVSLTGVKVNSNKQLIYRSERFYSRPRENNNTEKIIEGLNENWTKVQTLKD